MYRWRQVGFCASRNGKRGLVHLLLRAIAEVVSDDLKKVVSVPRPGYNINSLSLMML